jgi:hypothetical protein
MGSLSKKFHMDHIHRKSLDETSIHCGRVTHEGDVHAFVVSCLDNVNFSAASFFSLLSAT